MSERKFAKLNRYFVYLFAISITFGVFYNYFYLEDMYSVLVCFISPLMIFAPQLIRLIFGVRIRASYVFIYYIEQYFSLIIGEVIGVYLMNYWFDKLIHGYAGWMLFIMGLGLVYRRNSYEYIKNNFLIVLVKAFLFSLLLESAWELYELFSDLAFGSNMLQTGLMDSIHDYLMAFVGTIVGSIHAYVHFKVRPLRFMSLLLNEDDKLAKKE